MRKCLTIGIAVLLVVLISGLAQAADDYKELKTQNITLQLKDTPIKSALETIFMGTGLNLSIDSNVTGLGCSTVRRHST